LKKKKQKKRETVVLKEIKEEIRNQTKQRKKKNPQVKEIHL
jgi:hypothetical protein